MATQHQQQWPLKDENNTELILSSDLYWNYVFPYTAVDDRVVINKYTKSTQHYAGRRVEIDAAFLDKHRDEPQISMNIVNFIIVKISMGKGNLFMPLLKEEPSLDILRDIRRCWDEHLLTIDSPSERLHQCLQFSYIRDYPDSEIKMPLLFCGAGTVEDVIKLHSLMDINSINGCVDVDSSKSILFNDLSPVFPKISLGIWLDIYLKSTWRSQMMAAATIQAIGGISDTTIQFERIVRALLDAEGVDVASFFEPLDRNKIDLLISSFYPYQTFQSGMSIVDCMRGYSDGYFAHHPRNVEWVFEKLEAVHNNE